MSDITKIMEAYLGMVSEPQSGETLEEAVNMGPWNRGAINKAMSKAGIKGSQAKAFIAALRVSGTVDEEVETELDEVSEKKLDPVDDKANDKEFKNRKDKDIDNDGDVDSSDEYLHKKRAATDDAIDAKKKGGKVDEVSADLAKAATAADKVAINKTDDEKKDSPAPAAAPKKDSQTPSQKYADYKREGGKLSMDDWKKHQQESLDLDLTSSFEDMWDAISEAANHKKGALAPEKYDGHSSKHDKEVIAKHKKSDKKIEDNEEDGHTKTFAATKAVKKQAPARSGADNLSNGDKSVVNPVKGK
jgi:hypothetical protein